MYGYGKTFGAKGTFCAGVLNEILENYDNTNEEYIRNKIIKGLGLTISDLFQKNELKINRLLLCAIIRLNI